MTPERAAYHRLMLISGLGEEYQQELDLLLEQEDPLSDLVLELAGCMSDLRETISVLGHYIEEHRVDEQKVYDMLVATLRSQFAENRLTAVQVCETMTKIQRVCDFGEPWIHFYTYLYEYELMDEELISREVFEIGFASIFLRGKRISVFELQEEYKRKHFLRFQKRNKRKENLL